MSVKKKSKNDYLLLLYMNVVFIYILTIHVFTTTNTILRVITIIALLYNVFVTSFIFRGYLKNKNKKTEWPLLNDCITEYDWIVIREN